VPRPFNGEVKVFSTTGAGTNEYIHAKKKKIIYPYFTPYIKVNSK